VRGHRGARVSAARGSAARRDAHRGRAEEARWRRAAGLVTGLFALSHIAYNAAGVRFDSAGIGYFWQYLDPELLRHRLAESLLYLHSQPPLFNLFLGLALKACHGSPGVAFHVIYALLGIAISLSLLWLFRKLGVSLGLLLHAIAPRGRLPHRNDVDWRLIGRESQHLGDGLIAERAYRQ